MDYKQRIQINNDIDEIRKILRRLEDNDISFMFQVDRWVPKMDGGHPLYAMLFIDNMSGFEVGRIREEEDI